MPDDSIPVYIVQEVSSGKKRTLHRNMLLPLAIPLRFAKPVDPPLVKIPAVPRENVTVLKSLPEDKVCPQDTGDSDGQYGDIIDEAADGASFIPMDDPQLPATPDRSAIAPEPSGESLFGLNQFHQPDSVDAESEELSVDGVEDETIQRRGGRVRRPPSWLQNYVVGGTEAESQPAWLRKAQFLMAVGHDSGISNNPVLLQALIRLVSGTVHNDNMVVTSLVCRIVN